MYRRETPPLGNLLSSPEKAREEKSNEGKRLRLDITRRALARAQTGSIGQILTKKRLYLLPQSQFSVIVVKRFHQRGRII
jgi:hypothetical protein